MHIKAGKWLMMSPIQRLKTLRIVSRAQRLEVVLRAHGIDPAPLKATRKMLEGVLMTGGGLIE
mgnify:FL=1